MFWRAWRITRAVVMRDADGKSKWFGFVHFENADDAAQAVEVLIGEKSGDEKWYVGKAQKKSERARTKKSMNGKMVISKPLYVVQRKRREKGKVASKFMERNTSPLSLKAIVG